MRNQSFGVNMVNYDICVALVGSSKHYELVFLSKFLQALLHPGPDVHSSLNHRTVGEVYWQEDVARHRSMLITMNKGLIKIKN